MRCEVEREVRQWSSPAAAIPPGGCDYYCGTLIQLGCSCTAVLYTRGHSASSITPSSVNTPPNVKLHWAIKTM